MLTAPCLPSVKCVIYEALLLLPNVSIIVPKQQRPVQKAGAVVCHIRTRVIGGNFTRGNQTERGRSTVVRT